MRRATERTLPSSKPDNTIIWNELANVSKSNIHTHTHTHTTAGITARIFQEETSEVPETGVLVIVTIGSTYSQTDTCHDNHSLTHSLTRSLAQMLPPNLPWLVAGVCVCVLRRLPFFDVAIVLAGRVLRIKIVMCVVVVCVYGCARLYGCVSVRLCVCTSGNEH